MNNVINVDPACIDLVGETFDIIRNIQDPEKAQTLEELDVVQEELVRVVKLYEDEYLISIEFVPTVPHCSLASLIGLCIRVKLQENLLCHYKLDINIKSDSHNEAASISKQINDKERIAAAMENPALMQIIQECIGEIER